MELEWHYVFLVENSPQKVSMDKHSDPPPPPQQIKNLTVYKFKMCQLLLCFISKTVAIEFIYEKKKFSIPKNFVFRKDAYLVIVCFCQITDLTTNFLSILYTIGSILYWYYLRMSLKNIIC